MAIFEKFENSGFNALGSLVNSVVLKNCKTMRFIFDFPAQCEVCIYKNEDVLRRQLFNCMIEEKLHKTGKIQCPR